jgi:hypothetical protein
MPMRVATAHRYERAPGQRHERGSVAHRQRGRIRIGPAHDHRHAFTVARCVMTREQRGVCRGRAELGGHAVLVPQP